MKDIQRLDQLLLALDLEYSHEKTQFEETIKKLPIHELVLRGMAWYGLNISDSGYTIGEYPYLVLEIDESKLVPHQFKSGSMIRLFHQVNGDIQTYSLQASIYYISRNQVKIILEADEFPDWYRDGKLGIVADFDEKSIAESKAALMEVIKAKNNVYAELREKIYGVKPISEISKEAFFPLNKSLNASQINAVENILGMEDFIIIHGPPGTGKTTTLIEAIYQLSKKEKQILICAPSNNATDLLVEKLVEIGLKTLRIGNISRVNEAVISQTIESKIDGAPEMLEIKKLRKKANEFRSLAHKYKRQFGADEREQRRLLLNEVKDIMKHIRWIEDYLTKKIIEDTQVICTTLVGSTHSILKDISFSTVFIDEVSQALEPATWIPILKAQKFILAGDPFQLPPTVKSIEAEKQGLSTTLLDIGFQVKNRVMLLDTQYRMKSEIMQFSNQIFYENKLQSAPNTDQHFFEIKDKIYPSFLFIDTAGCGYEEKINPNTASIFNPDEAKLVLDYLAKNLIELKYQYDHLSVGVVAPYREQVEYLKNLDLDLHQLRLNYGVHISTIDSFQGQERDIIFISLVRSNDEGTIGFLRDYRRINVALTRAKKMLCVFGDSATLSQDKFYADWIEYCHQQNSYLSAWEIIEY